MKIAILTDNRQKNEFIQQVADGENQAKALLEAWNKLPLQKITTKDQLLVLIDGSLQQFVTQMLPDQSEPVKLFGVTLKPSRIVELMDIDTTEVERIKSGLDLRTAFVFNQVSTVKNGKLMIDDKAYNDMLDSFTVYATTENQKKKATAYLKMIEGLNDLVQQGVHKDLFLHGASSKKWFKWDGSEFIADPIFYEKLVR